MSKKSVGGRPAIYSPKDGKVQIRAITKEGSRILDKARKLVKQATRWPGKVSDGDVIDFVLRYWHSGLAAVREISEIKKREK